MAWKRIEAVAPPGVDFCLPADLSKEDRELLRRAFLIRGNAYAPYSHYLVGAAVRSAKSGVYVGCNAEVCSYSQTTHAEQSAFARMIAYEGPAARVASVAIVAAHEREHPPNPMYVADWTGWPDVGKVNDLSWASIPCGHCLQTLSERNIGPAVRLIGYHPTGIVSVTTLGEALPFALSPEHIE